MPPIDYTIESILEDADVLFEKKLKAGSWSAYDSPAHMGLEQLADNVALSLNVYHRPGSPKNFDTLEAWAMGEGVTFLVYPDTPCPKFTGWTGWLVGSPVRTGNLPPNTVYISRPEQEPDEYGNFHARMLDIPSPYALMLPTSIRHSSLQAMAVSREPKFIRYANDRAYWKQNLWNNHNEQLDEDVSLYLHPSPQLFLPIAYAVNHRQRADFPVMVSR